MTSVDVGALSLFHARFNCLHTSKHTCDLIGQTFMHGGTCDGDTLRRNTSKSTGQFEVQVADVRETGEVCHVAGHLAYQCVVIQLQSAASASFKLFGIHKNHQQAGMRFSLGHDLLRPFGKDWRQSLCKDNVHKARQPS